ncbi:Deoxyadenosine kinase @ Deoxyguanosine kinase [hydrothermal vent metagenome]|uniref:Deoxyadenosine kinase @ Deoxyguanosine kinase n=1 Tax=hydrothermal vent metagenome TaxID=652676 RepID=A0A3B1C5H6_9ZZZZ
MREQNNPGFIVVEGPIGVGKTTLARRLADSFHSDLLLEGLEDNPFLRQFYEDPRSAALQTQLFFLFQRGEQIRSLRQADMFQPVRIADFIMEKDRLFAELTLDSEEFKLYEQVYSHVTANVTADAPRPDLVVYLQAPVEVLKKRISERGREFERTLDVDYLQKLSESYMHFFHNYNDAPLLIVNATELDFAHNDDDYSLLLAQIKRIKTGRHYFNPTSSLELRA